MFLDISRGLLVLGVLIALFGLGTVLRNNVKGQIHKQLDMLADSTSVEDLEVNLLAGNISVKNILFYDYSLDDSTSSQAPVRGTVSRFSVKGLSYWHLLTAGKIDIREVNCGGVALSVDRDRFKKHKERQPENSGIPGISIDQLNVSDVELSVVTELHKSQTIHVENIRSSIKDFEVKPGSSFDMEFWDFVATKIRFTDVDSLHTIFLDSMIGESEAGQLAITEFRVYPNYDRKSFVSKLDFRTSMLSLSLPQLVFKEVDFKSIFEGNFNCGIVEINDFSFELFEDQNVPAGQKVIKTLPHHSLANFQRKLEIDSVVIRNGDIVVEFLFEGEMRPVAISFNDLKGSIENLHSCADTDEMMVVRVHSRFQDQSDFDLSAHFPLSSSVTKAFSFQGHLSKFPVENINPVLERSAEIHFDKGFIDDLYFSVTADDHLAEGELRVFYRDMDMELDRRSEESFLLKPLDEIVEHVTARNENLPDDTHIVGSIYFPRNQHKSLPHYMWNAVFSGIKSTFLPNILLPDELHRRKVQVD